MKDMKGGFTDRKKIKSTIKSDKKMFLPKSKIRPYMDHPYISIKSQYFRQN